MEQRLGTSIFLITAATISQSTLLPIWKRNKQHICTMWTFPHSVSVWLSQALILDEKCGFNKSTIKLYSHAEIDS